MKKQVNDGTEEIKKMKNDKMATEQKKKYEIYVAAKREKEIMTETKNDNKRKRAKNIMTSNE